MLLTLGTGVGGGVVLNGKVYEGDVGPGTEMGHTTLILGGEPCTCGQRGCLEAYASATDCCASAIGGVGSPRNCHEAL